MKTIRVIFEVDVPDVGATEQDIEDWVKYHVKEDFLSVNSPLYDCQFKARHVDIEDVED